MYGTLTRNMLNINQAVAWAMEEADIEAYCSGAEAQHEVCCETGARVTSCPDHPYDHDQIHWNWYMHFARIWASDFGPSRHLAMAEHIRGERARLLLHP